jgi:hypothetical protein
MRRIGVLMPGTQSDQEEQLRVTAFQQRLAKLGWTGARNVQIGWGGVRMRTFATELVGLRPDVLFAGNMTTLVFYACTDPIAGGFRRQSAAESIG